MIVDMSKSYNSVIQSVDSIMKQEGLSDLRVFIFGNIPDPEKKPVASAQHVKEHFSSKPL